jgi:DNA polymerase-4
MLARAFVRLEARGRGISRINLWTLSLLREHREKDINFKEPAMNVKTALTRIRHVMESCPQPGPVEQLGIKVTGLGRQKGKQKSLFTEVRAQEHLLEDVRQLEFRLGGPQVYSVKEVEPWSRIPERRYALIPLSR